MDARHEYTAWHCIRTFASCSLTNSAHAVLEHLPQLFRNTIEQLDILLRHSGHAPELVHTEAEPGDRRCTAFGLETIVVGLIQRVPGVHHVHVAIVRECIEHLGGRKMVEIVGDVTRARVHKHHDVFCLARNRCRLQRAPNTLLKLLELNHLEEGAVAVRVDNKLWHLLVRVSKKLERLCKEAFHAVKEAEIHAVVSHQIRHRV
mmetsp:Transcript_20380/g.52939  ORF Transcript_20380/g.52939 Transcript_20380/m.52939 type:complete len:204 (-) Transcript_20380:1665-2276(-)